MLQKQIRSLAAIFALSSIIACSSWGLGSRPSQNLPNVSSPEGEKINEDPENSMESLWTDIKPETWGGPGIILTIGKSSTKIELDCANGAVPGPFRTKKNGSFSLKGSLTQRSFGPVIANSILRAQPATFEGKVSGNRMSFKITIVETGKVFGSYDLEAGKPSEMTRCY